MNVRINQGYVITDSIHIGKAEFVIGEMSNTPAPFVTWECKDGNNYFWGHYLTPQGCGARPVGARSSGTGVSNPQAGRDGAAGFPLGRNPDP